MKRLAILILLFISMHGVAAAQQPTGFVERVKAIVDKHMGRPYVWGASGLKGFDCSGFIWRVMYEQGTLLKRTTARKYYMVLPPASPEDQTRFGTFVFFDNLKHVGMIDNDSAFYHAQVTRGTNRSEMNSFWRRKIYGFRRFPAAE